MKQDDILKYCKHWQTELKKTTNWTNVGPDKDKASTTNVLRKDKNILFLPVVFYVVIKYGIFDIIITVSQNRIDTNFYFYKFLFSIYQILIFNVQYQFQSEYHIAYNIFSFKYFTMILTIWKNCSSSLFGLFIRRTLLNDNPF